ncbi:MAG: hypothetical protein KGJ37_04140 [Verrucomicrobiota bacterium]|nr:hypothetical protein [Verrucomicrobiota bacterium]
MKNGTLFKIFLAIMLFPLVAAAQPPDTRPDYWSGSDQWGPHKGSNEITLGASGTSNRRMDNSAGGANLSLGNFFTDTTEIVLRQSVDYTNPDVGGQQWDGSTRVALDQHFPLRGTGHMWSAVLPFVGANFGGAYGDKIRDTWDAGLEGGAKFYTAPRTFVFAEAEYDWFFRHANSALNTNKFKDGEWNWGVGLGFNF